MIGRLGKINWVHTPDNRGLAGDKEVATITVVVVGGMLFAHGLGVEASQRHEGMPAEEHRGPCLQLACISPRQRKQSD